jgi:hypothetical protein
VPRRVACLAGLVLAAGTFGTFVTSLTSGALAADAPQPSFAGPPEDIGVERPEPPDQRTGHIYLAGSFGAIGPAGEVSALVPAQSIAGVGYDFGATLGVGLGRYGVLQAYGNRTVFTSPANCNMGCSGLAYALGLGVVYHLIQGIAVDPWGSFGMGYRTATFEVVAPGNSNNVTVSQFYQGFDVARIAFGGDYYPVPWLGFGPFVEADVGTNLHRPAPLVTLPPNVIEGPRVYGFFQIGVRIALDPMRQGSLPRVKAASISSSAPGM